MLPPTSLTVLLSHARVFWKHWNVQSMVLTSFIIQLLLIFLAPFRKHTSNVVVFCSIWLAYLLADWVAIQSIGLISEADTCGSSAYADHELYAFWAQFLLLHLGGPDTITALALEDNELWLRTGLHLAVQIYGSLGILVKSVGSHSQTSLWLPMILMFAAGIFKYMERLSALFYGRITKYLDFTGFISLVLSEDGQKSEAELVKDSLACYMRYRGVYAGATRTDGMAYGYMLKRTPEEAFRVLEIQFNLAYEALYTKTGLICSKRRWKALHLVVTLLQVGCLMIWFFFTDKERFQDYNIRITHTLIVGAIAVDLLSFFRVRLCSDWVIALKVGRHMRWHGPAKRGYSRLARFYDMILSRKRTWGSYKGWEDAPLSTSFRRLLFRRWSESIPQLSLLTLAMGDQSNKVLDFIWSIRGIKQSKYVIKKWFSNHLRDFLYHDITNKAKTRGAIENIGKVKGGWACHNLMSKYQTNTISIPIICELLDLHGEYYLILLRWHIITELCYHGDQLSHVKNDAINTSSNDNRSNLAEEACNYKDICKILSDYLIYLLIHRQDMLPVPPMANGELSWAFKYMKEIIYEYKWPEEGRIPIKSESSVCTILREKLTREKFESSYANRFPIEDILGELKEMEKKQIDKWEFMAMVWSELLYYAAIQCEPSLYAANLKQGGELLSFVWLLLLHMGFGLDKTDKPAKALLYESDFEQCYVPP